MGGDIQYGIVDVVTMVSEVVNHQEILRSLSKTLLVKTLVRKSVRQIQKERLSIGKSFSVHRLHTAAKIILGPMI